MALGFHCRQCGFQSPKWLGRCPQCQAWDTFAQAIQAAGGLSGAEVEPQALDAIPLPHGTRLATGVAEFDRVLGGGAICGSLVLIGGEPGIGKSTLLLQVAGGLARQLVDPRPILYVSGEEAAAQIKLRAQRLGLDAGQRLLVLTDQRLASVENAMAKAKPAAVVVDSVQSILPAEGKEGLGSTWQVGQLTFALNQLAKAHQAPIFLIGHVTKAGELAGPKAIEHLVDVVLYLEGTRHGDVRLLRSVKNRYGSTAELGVFQMKPNGLEDITNPSQFFTQRQGAPLPGSIIVPTIEGTRPILVELQALVASNHGAGYPQRRATGWDANRLILLIAVLEKRLGLNVGGHDVYVNVAGGLTVKETACDLGVCLAVVSSLKNRAPDGETVVVGEVGLSGEVRMVERLEPRLREAAQLGYKKAIIPSGERRLKTPLEISPVANLAEAVERLSL
ncbi:MAG TPA: DNA repair protein RadA [Candidatus Bipolaricaulota bacterium]